MSTPLPALDGYPFVDAPRWHYPAWRGSPGGWCRLRAWREPGLRHVICVVTELRDDNPGVSVTNAAEHIQIRLRGKFGQAAVVQLEHYPPDPESTLEFCRGDRLDYVKLTAGHAEWEPVWPVSEDHPDYVLHASWWDLYGHQITTTTREDTSR